MWIKTGESKFEPLQIFEKKGSQFQLKCPTLFSSSVQYFGMILKLVRGVKIFENKNIKKEITNWNHSHFFLQFPYHLIIVARSFPFACIRAKTLRYLSTRLPISFLSQWAGSPLTLHRYQFLRFPLSLPLQNAVIRSLRSGYENR